MVIVKHGQTVFGLEGVYQILRGLVEIPSTRPDAPTAVERVGPVGAAKLGVVVLVSRVLDSKNGLLIVVILREKQISKVFQVAIAGGGYDVRVVYDFLHIVGLDVAHAGVLLVAIAPRESQIAFGEIGRCCNLVDTPLVLGSSGQHIVGRLEVGNDFCKQLLVGQSIVFHLFLGIILKDLFVNPRHFAEHGGKLVVEVCAEEFHFGHALLRLLFT